MVLLLRSTACRAQGIWIATPFAETHQLGLMLEEADHGGLERGGIN